MRAMRGIVLRVEGRHVVVVTDEGDFLRVPKPKQQLLPGQVIEVPSQKRRSLRPYLAVAAAVLLIFVISALKPLAITPAVAAVASVSLDMTPSVELTVSKENTVIGAKAQNPEGERLLQQLQLKGLDVYKAVNLITAKAAEMNFFSSEAKNMALATVMPLKGGDGSASINKEEVMRVIHDEMYARKYDGYVVVNQAQKEVRQQAEEAQLPVNRYLLLEKSREQGVEIAPETLRSTPLPRVMETTGMDVPKAFPGDWCEVSERGWGMGGRMGGMNTPGIKATAAPAPANTSPNPVGTVKDSGAAGGASQPQPAPGVQGYYPWQGPNQLNPGPVKPSSPPQMMREDWTRPNSNPVNPAGPQMRRETWCD